MPPRAPSLIGGDRLLGRVWLVWCGIRLSWHQCILHSVLDNSVSRGTSDLLHGRSQLQVDLRNAMATHQLLRIEVFFALLVRCEVS